MRTTIGFRLAILSLPGRMIPSKLREGWAERITRLRERLEGMKKQMAGAKQIAQLAGRLRNQ
jgi:hypothetical protein